MTDFQSLWNNVREKLKTKIAANNYELFFNDAKKVLKEANGVIFVEVPSTYIQHQINTLYYKLIEKVLLEIEPNKKYKFKFVLKEEVEKTQPEPVPFSKLNKNDLNLSYTFESFVVGESNKFAFLTASAVVENPGTLYNPMYIFGGVGLGKTHLMQAMGNYLSDLDVNKKIVYVQASDYLNDYTKSVRDNNLAAFEEKYNNLDVLLIDDIQMLADAAKTQQQFFNLFERMFSNKKQIVITSDKPANKLNGFMDRLTSRFLNGAIVNINQPDLNQRINILKRKIQEEINKDIPDDVLQYIAENFTDNVRELKGALTRVNLYSDFNNKPITLDLAKEALNILIKKPKDENNYDKCLSIIASYYSIQVVDILGNSRIAKIVLPRHIAMYILKTKYKLNYSEIGKILNNKDHTSVMNGYNKIENGLKTNDELKMAIDAILKKL